jgi:hypothetical protein
MWDGQSHAPSCRGNNSWWRGESAGYDPDLHSSRGGRQRSLRAATRSVFGDSTLGTTYGGAPKDEIRTGTFAEDKIRHSRTDGDPLKAKSMEVVFADQIRYTYVPLVEQPRDYRLRYALPDRCTTPAQQQRVEVAAEAERQWREQLERAADGTDPSASEKNGGEEVAQGARSPRNPRMVAPPASPRTSAPDEEMGEVYKVLPPLPFTARIAMTRRHRANPDAKRGRIEGVFDSFVTNAIYVDGGAAGGGGGAAGASSSQPNAGNSGSLSHSGRHAGSASGGSGLDGGLGNLIPGAGAPPSGKFVTVVTPTTTTSASGATPTAAVTHRQKLEWQSRGVAALPTLVLAAAGRSTCQGSAAFEGAGTPRRGAGLAQAGAASGPQQQQGTTARRVVPVVYDPSRVAAHAPAEDRAARERLLTSAF